MNDLLIFSFKMVRSPNLSVMLAIGNALSNSVYEANVSTGIVKPSPQSSREEKEIWIRRKYESKEFIPETNRSAPNGKLLIEAVVRYFQHAILILKGSIKHFHVIFQIRHTFDNHSTDTKYGDRC